jgi:hypothetical protein
MKHEMSTACYELQNFDGCQSSELKGHMSICLQWMFTTMKKKSVSRSWSLGLSIWIFISSVTAVLDIVEKSEKSPKFSLPVNSYWPSGRNSDSTTARWSRVPSIVPLQSRIQPLTLFLLHYNAGHRSYTKITLRTIEFHYHIDVAYQRREHQHFHPPQRGFSDI